ncbi:site-2 protease family protein [Heliobacterium gestii]|uniref:Site-2 protease family protein n=1 Tax=Heliomicrobium gestii TaxID=2699 RepID=A0A845L9R6_HELGE|nr:site-2 protease family protein [Heliomicrobium gestii]MBM7865413.1 Zn-dependent protease [Heliomicrobium gestii]MZP41670.1 site-2 protease family protein [Heliomicrobium gestii]
MFDFNLTDLIARAPAILIALALHEYAHARMAVWLGDPTPRWEGRLTINPLSHLDPIGALMLIFGPFGWAKPVGVNPYNFRGNKQRGMMLVALAGPLMNVFLAILSVALFVGFGNIAEARALLVSMISINVGLAVFNLLPVPPLDGSKVLAGLLPYRSQGWLRQLEQYGPILLLVLVFFPVISDRLFRPLYKALYSVVLPVGTAIGQWVF